MKNLDRTAKIGIGAVAAVLLAGVLTFGITQIVTAQNANDKAVRCAVTDVCD